MTSGPYQSKLLRLAIAQYRQGVDRHHRAVRQARSTAILGVELGTVLALTPVSAAMKVAQNAGVKVRRAVIEGDWFALAADVVKMDATKLLDFSDFAEVATETYADRGRASLIGSALAEGAIVSEGSMVQTLRAVGSCLSSRQVKALLKIGHEARNSSDSNALAQMPLAEQLVRVGRRSVAGILRWVDFKNGETNRVDSAIASAQSNVLGLQKVTGVASSLETRSLQLVLGHTTVWDGLSARQQARLQQKILRLLEGDIEPRSFWPATFFAWKSRPTAALLGQQSALVRPVNDFWVDVLRAVLWLKQRLWSKPISHLTGSIGQMEGANSAVNQLASVLPRRMASATQPTLPAVSIDVELPIAETSSLPVLSGKQDVISLRESRSSSTHTKRVQRSASLVSQGKAEANSQRRQADYWETDVIAIDYIEHPLETVLKWVDRILLWIEAQWQRLQSWLSC